MMSHLKTHYVIWIESSTAEKGRELGNAHDEIKSSKATEVMKDKAIEEVTNVNDKMAKTVC